MGDLARFRLFCPVLPSRNPWGARAQAALRALEPHGVRAVPIGGHLLDSLPGMEDWAPLSRLFTGSLGPEYVNIVLAPPRLPLGAPLSPEALAPRKLPGVAGKATERGENHLETAYAPETAIVGLRVVLPGVLANVLITATSPAPTAAEVAAMRCYDKVFVCSERERNIARGLEVPALFLDDFLRGWWWLGGSESSERMNESE